ncbi:MFS transporter [Pseudomonas typographi]|uniref:MFS transporter n=1 Tax=Pseudomonas typographi TaxID=2715964 RepID=UPI001683BFE8|nr:MFS transporter [Pseudomonas typographi]MBD1551614.1 MFS transporter [Pseudomonas typographi]MBD1589801.1 MFS transporter [Pseudomonas typographi]
MGSPARGWWGVWAVLAVVVIAYIDRVNMAVMVVDPAFLEHFGLAGDRAGQGALMTAFLLGYGVAAIGLTPLLESRFGYRAGLLFSVVAWALLTACVPWASGLGLLLLLRVLLGVAEGPLFSLKTMLIADGFAAGQRGKPNAVSSMGVSIGLAAGYPLMAAWLQQWGWQGAFYGLGLLNAVLGVGLVLAFVPAPQQQPIRAQRPGPWQLLCQALGMPHLAGVLLVEICTLAYLWGSTAWLPAYLMHDKGFSLKAMGMFSALPFLFALASNGLGGWLADRLGPLRAAWVFVAGGLLCALCVWQLTGSQGNAATLAWLLAAACAWGVQGAAIPTLVQHLAAPGQVGSAYGWVNGIGNLVAAGMPVAMGSLMGQYVAAGFVLLIAAQLLSAAGGGWLVWRLRRR